VIRGELIGRTRASAGLLVLVVGLLASAPLGAEAVRIAPAVDLSPCSAKSTEIMHARYFSPTLGRFLSVDPVGGEVGSSQSWNRYTYALNNPIVFVDPDGRDEYVLTWIQRGNNIGHSAAAVQIRDSSGSPTGLVVVQDLWPAPPGVAFPNLAAPASYDADVMSDSDLTSFEGHGEGRGPDGVIRISGDQQQDATFQAGLDQFAANNPVYHATDANCADFTAAGVSPTGLPTGNGATVSISVGPLDLSKQNVSTPVALHNALAGSDDPRVQVIQPVPDDDPNLRLKW